MKGMSKGIGPKRLGSPNKMGHMGKSAAKVMTESEYNKARKRDDERIARNTAREKMDEYRKNNRRAFRSMPEDQEKRIKQSIENAKISELRTKRLDNQLAREKLARNKKSPAKKTGDPVKDFIKSTSRKKPAVNIKDNPMERIGKTKAKTQIFKDMSDELVNKTGMDRMRANQYSMATINMTYPATIKKVGKEAGAKTFGQLADAVEKKYGKK